jgi:DNA-binding response OmpR family regulator
MVEAKKKILIVEDDLDLANILTAYFGVQGYEVSAVTRGEEAVLQSQTASPDAVILDFRLPDMDGFEVARRLRSNRRTADVPILFLTEKREPSERLHGLERGTDDYILKLIDAEELELQIRTALKRAKHDPLTNQVTDLPEGKLVDERISTYLNRQNWTMLIISLENMVIFRESYGIAACDDVLRTASLMVHNTMKELGSQDDFLGHLSPTDFVLITEKYCAASLLERVRSHLDQSLVYFYPIKDREKHEGHSKRMFVRTGILRGSDSHFSSPDELKSSLMRNKYQAQP